MKTLIAVGAICVALVLGCKSLGNLGKRSSTNFDPYKGKLSELIPDKLAGDDVEFTIVGTADSSTYPGSTEAKTFTYMQESSIGVSVKVDGAVVNYPSAVQAEAKLADVARLAKVEITAKGKGKKLEIEGGKMLVWTNGSVLGVSQSGFAQAAKNFENAAPF